MVCARSLILSSCVMALLSNLTPLWAAEAARGKNAPAAHWLSSYRDAVTAADRQNKMLLIYFRDRGTGQCERLEKETLDDPQVRGKLRDYVCVRLPVDTKITVQGKQVVLLEHEAFREMLGRPGVAIVDYRADAAPRGSVVSEFPITETLWYTPQQMAAILALPPGTLTQRTLIYAVRTHPDHPASTDGEPNTTLLEEAQSHAQYQADIRVQGHHFWGSRFSRILSRLPGGCAPREVCAESWGGQHLVDAAIECVRCWRLSSGHWSAVCGQSRFFGYDMKRGGNGVWYATGIVDAR
ncbi:MAG: thioredoxin family protein [Thermoguttaceae bacterium]